MLFAGLHRDPRIVWFVTRYVVIADAGAPLPARYFRYFRAWVALGIPAFLSLVAVFYLMVAKPA